MPTHAETVLAAILSKDAPRRDLLAIASVKLQQEHFTNEVTKNIYLMVRAYFDATGDIMPSYLFAQKLQDTGVETAKALAFAQTFKALEDTQVSEAEFKWSVQELRDNLAKRKTGIAITEAMEILERGYEVGKEFYKGHTDARRFLSAKVVEIERDGAVDQTPEGNIFDEAQTILEDYQKRKDGEIGRGVTIGIRAVDDHVGGFQRGELVLVAGPPGTGKTQIVSQAAWSAAVEQKQNVFFATSETVRNQVMRRILARHSRLPQFERPDGINANDLKRGLLTESDERVFHEVLVDWTRNTEYGKLHILQVPRGATLSYIEGRLREFGRENECGLVVIDYLALLKAEAKRTSSREELNDILKGAKLVATSFNDGEGVPLISPWQINREGQKSSATVGFYTMAALAETSEAERSSDAILAASREPDNTTQMHLQWLKMRDGALPPACDVAIDFRSSFIGSTQMATSIGATHSSASADMLRLLS